MNKTAGIKSTTGTKLRYLIFVFPVLYLFLGLYFRQIFGDLSLRSTDPEYIHFLSGMCISTGKFNMANIDHPGSALQLVLAIVFRLVYFFRGNANPFFEDAMINSDLYLSVSNLVITVIIVGTLYWAGHRILKITTNISYALLVQTSPFLIDIWYEIYGRIYPELLILIPVLIIQVQLIKELYSDKSTSTKDILTYSFAIAMGMSLKMTFLPLVFIPLITIRSVKNKLLFILCSALMFLTISLPVTFQLERFWNWMKGIFIHSGAYQSGESDIVNWSLFADNLKNIITSEKLFFIGLLLLAIGLIVLLFKPKREKKELPRIIIALTVAFVGVTFIVSKQFALRYFLPALLFSPFLLILILEIFKSYLTRKSLLIGLTSVIVLLVGYNLNRELIYIRITSEGIQKQMQARIESRNVIGSLNKDSYKIIVSQDYGCPYHEYAIMYSFCVAGGGWPGYKEKLDKIYPNTYMYFTWDNTLKFWGTEFNPNEIIASTKPVYLYLEKNSNELYERTINKFFGEQSQFDIEKQLIFENPENGEGILQLLITQKETNENL